jgi:hypothetical protein
MWEPLVAFPLSRVLKGRNSASLATDRKKDLVEMMLWESLEVELAFSETDGHPRAVLVPPERLE